MASYTGGQKESSRIQALGEQRKIRQEEIERKKGAIAGASSNALNTATGRKFAARSETVEDLLKSDTVGLVTHEDFKARRKYLEQCAAEEREKRESATREREAESRKQRLKKANRATLSFAADDSDEDEEEGSDGEIGRSAAAKRKGVADAASVPGGSDANADVPANGTKPEAPAKRRRLGKNPDADTTFLPDRELEIAQQSERARLRQEWINEQERIKSEMVKITYSYWDGSGHRRTLECKKGTTIGRFLCMVQAEFKELRNTSASDLMYVK